jgi:uncharacterized protein YciI
MSEPKVTKADILAACEGMLRKNLYVVITTPTGGLGPVMANLEPHLKYQVSLEEQGVMFGAGPLFLDNEVDWAGEGMVIIRADSLADAARIASEDPMHSCGARSFTVRPWLLNEGSVTLRVRYSNGSREVI